MRKLYLFLNLTLSRGFKYCYCYYMKTRFNQIKRLIEKLNINQLHPAQHIRHLPPYIPIKVHKVYELQIITSQQNTSTVFEAVKKNQQINKSISCKELQTALRQLAARQFEMYIDYVQLVKYNHNSWSSFVLFKINQNLSTAFHIYTLELLQTAHIS